jgi:uncharacterized protein YejL (UPF0352 family)
VRVGHLRAVRSQRAERLNVTDSETPPQYDIAKVEAVILEVAAELHPQHLTARDLSLKVVGNANDTREVETAAQAILGLREFGLFAIQDDEIVEPTPAALRACALLT